MQEPGCDINLELGSVDDMIDWSVNEPDLQPENLESSQRPQIQQQVSDPSNKTNHVVSSSTIPSIQTADLTIGKDGKGSSRSISEEARYLNENVKGESRPLPEEINHLIHFSSDIQKILHNKTNPNPSSLNNVILLASLSPLSCLAHCASLDLNANHAYLGDFESR
jgi:hypothetical protein